MYHTQLTFIDGCPSMTMTRECFFTLLEHKSKLLCEPELFLCTEFLVQFEEDRWEPNRWQNLSTYPGDLNSVILQLVPFVNYQFRVIAINAVGQSEPSGASPRYKTSGAGESAPSTCTQVCVCVCTYV